MPRRKKNKRRYRTSDVDSPLFDADDYAKSCASKNGYDSEWQAQYVIDDAMSRFGTRLSSYRCPYCGEWHLTGG